MARSKATCEICQQVFGEFKDARVHIKNVHFKCGGYCRYRHSYDALCKVVNVILTRVEEDPSSELASAIEQYIPNLRQIGIVIVVQISVTTC
jgi:hypothetical protein